MSNGDAAVDGLLSTEEDAVPCAQVKKRWRQFNHELGTRLWRLICELLSCLWTSLAECTFACSVDQLLSIDTVYLLCELLSVTWLIIPCIICSFAFLGCGITAGGSVHNTGDTDDARTYGLWHPRFCILLQFSLESLLIIMISDYDLNSKFSCIRRWKSSLGRRRTHASISDWNCYAADVFVWKLKYLGVWAYVKW